MAIILLGLSLIATALGYIRILLINRKEQLLVNPFSVGAIFLSLFSYQLVLTIDVISYSLGGPYGMSWALPLYLWLSILCSLICVGHDSRYNMFWNIKLFADSAALVLILLASHFIKGVAA